jgi:hypothetical protein
MIALGANQSSSNLFKVHWEKGTCVASFCCPVLQSYIDFGEIHVIDLARSCVLCLYNFSSYLYVLFISILFNYFEKKTVLYLQVVHSLILKIIYMFFLKKKIIYMLLYVNYSLFFLLICIILIRLKS